MRTHLPKSNPASNARREYAPYRTLSEETARLLTELRVQNVTAIYYSCSRDYTMPPRVIGDDMFYYVVQGKGEVLVEDRVTKIKAGQTAHFARGVSHAASTDRRDPMHVIALHYHATFFDSLTLPQLLPFPDVTQVGLDGAFHEMAGIACREYALQPAGWERGLEALMSRLLLFFIREHRPATGILCSTKLREVRRVLPALETMKNNLSRSISIEELASTCHFSVPHFRRVFSRALNATPNEYLRRLRIEEAALLLRRTDETIEAVAARVGYSDPSFFAHSFKAMMKTSPGKYRALTEL